MNRKQLEALHRVLPEDWTPVDEVRRAVAELLSLPEWDRAAVDGVMLAMSIDGIAEHRGNNARALWRRGVLPPELSPLEQLRAAEDKRLADLRQEQEEEFERRARANRYAEAVHQAPERARAYMFIDQRVREWATLLGFTPEQIQSAVSQLSNPSIVPPPPAEPPRLITHLPPGAIVTGA